MIFHGAKIWLIAILMLSNSVFADSDKNMLSKVLDANAGNILSPEQVGSIKWENIPENFSFAHEHKALKKDSPNFGIVESRLYKIVGDKYYFKVYHRGELVAGNLEMWSDGISYISRSNDSYSVDEALFSPSNECHLVLGECSYPGYKEEIIKVVTTFESGVWISIVSSRTMSYVKKSIYDRMGIELIAIVDGENKFFEKYKTLMKRIN